MIWVRVFLQCTPRVPITAGVICVKHFLKKKLSMIALAEQFVELAQKMKILLYHFTWLGLSKEL